MKTFFRFLLPLLILAMGIGGSNALLKIKQKSKPIEIKEKIYPVSTLSVTLATLSPTLTLYGRVESPYTATLRTPNQSFNLNAQVIAVAVREGEKVLKNNLLIQLEDNDSHLNLKQRKADIVEIEAQIELEKQDYTRNLTALTHEETLLSLTQKTVERLRQLKKQRVSSQSALEEAQQAVERQMLAVIHRRLEIKNYKTRLLQLQAKRSRVVAQRDLARLEIVRTKITAPFNGIIAQVFVAIGDRVRSGDPLLSLYDNTVLELRAQIPNRFSGKILDALTGGGYQLQAYATLNKNRVLLQLDRVSGQINPDSGGIDALFRVIEGSHLLRLGQFLTVYLNLPQQSQVVALPFEAVYGTDRIYKQVDGRMRGLMVERVGEQILSSGKSHILVRSPALQKGDQVVITQLPNAMDGLKVQIQP